MSYNDPKMQINLRIIACCVLLFFVHVKAQLSDEECAAYHDMVTQADYETFVDDCAGKEVLGFDRGVSDDFHASFLNEHMFNKVFANARRVSFHIYVQNTDFKEVRMSKLEYLNGGLTIRNNVNLKSFRIQRRWQFERTQAGPTTVTVDGNPMLDSDSMSDLRHLCPHCDIFPWTKCSALDPVEFSNYDKLIQQCAGERIIKVKPMTSMTLHLNKITERQFKVLFSQATHVQMGISMQDVQWTQLTFPKLVRHIPCGPGERTLRIVHNDKLKWISLPMYHSEGFGRLNPMWNVEVRNNILVTGQVLNPLAALCRFCKVQVYKECDSITVQDARNVTKFVELCGGKRIWKPSGNQIIEIDISVLKQEFVDELFQDVTYIKMCITLRNSQIKYLRMPNLVEMYPCKPGRLAFTIENNPYLEVIQVSTTFKWEICDHSFHIVYNPGLTQYPPVEKCKYCVLKPIMKGCGLEYRRYSDVELVQKCAGAEYIAPTGGFYLTLSSSNVTQEQMNAFCANAIYMQICIFIVNSDYTALRCPRLKEIRPCLPGRPALTIVNNLVFQELIIADTIIFPENDLIFKITENPNLPIPVVNKLKHMCERCEISANLECGLQGGTYTEQQLAAACAGKKIIRPAEGSIIVFSSPKVTEAQMNAICSQAVFMEVCIDIINSQYTSLRCPHLKELKPCQPGRPAIRIINNLQLKIVEFNTFIFPTGVTIIEINGNPLLPMTAINPLKRICPGCKINDDSQCQLEARLYSGNEVVRVCAGKEVIKGRQGFPLRVSSKDVTEKQMNALCANAVYMEICITIVNSNFKSLRCPRLHEIRPCQPGQPAIKIVDNIQFQELVITDTIIFPQTELIFEITENPNLPITVVNKLKHQCERCQITADLDCGLQGRYTSQQLIAACAGKKIIRPGEGRMMVFGSAGVTERQMNAICSQAIYMEVCIDVIKSQYTALRCPYLRELKPCHPGRPAIRIINNLLLKILEFNTFIFPTEELIIEITGNPLLPNAAVNPLKKLCPGCKIDDDSQCQLKAWLYSGKQIAQLCAGKEVIKGRQGFPLVVSSKDVTEKEMNALCANAVYMEICISIMDSNFKSLRCPRLKEIRPCQPGQPALVIEDNLLFQELVIMDTIIFPENDLIFQITGNPNLPITVINKLKHKCEHCLITANLDCGLQGRFTSQQLIAACAGKKIIRPSEGHIIQFHSSQVTQSQMNAICSQAIFMEVCIDIFKSQYKAFRCPYLKELKPCQPGRPAIRIVDNLLLQVLEIRTPFIFLPSPFIIEITGNPLLSSTALTPLKQLCPGCKIDDDSQCQLKAWLYSGKQIAQLCAGKEVIKGRQGFPLVVSSKDVTEKEMNALCANAVYMEICISIMDSNFKSLRCPRLKEIRPCQPGQPALVIEDNVLFQELVIMDTIIFPENDLIFQITGNPNLPITVINKLKHKCEHCLITANLDCGLQGRFTSQQLIAACAGKKIIRPSERHIIQFHSSQVTEAQMNAICSQAIFMEVCIDISMSQYKAFRCPYLKELKPCHPGRPAIRIINNLLLQILEFNTFIFPTGELIIEITGNPLLPNAAVNPLKKLCPGCNINGENQCKLEARFYSGSEVASICAGKQIIKGQKGFPLVVSSKDVTEKQMNALCANAVYMEICITIMNSNFTSLRCPHLKEIRPCQPGRPAIKIVDNIQFQELVIMDTIIFPQTELIFEITENPNLPIPVVNKLKHECERCNITANLDCGLQGGTYTNQQLVAACAGKKIIRPAEGHKIQFTSPRVTQSQMNAICSQAIFMEVCIDIMNSQYTALQCPYLMELKSCQPGRPAIRIVNNFEFETLIIPWQFIFPVGELIIEISDNPRLPNTIIDKLKILCPGCKITANLGCGLQKRTYSDNELVDACAGKSIIKPAQGYILTLHSHSVTEAQLNALCSKAVYMEICITIYHSQYTQLRCPYLRELRPCLPGQPAINVTSNSRFQNLLIPPSTIYPEGSLIIEVIENPMIPLTEIKSLKNWCKQCIILPDRPQGLKKCVLEERGYNGTELVSTCAGKEHIQPHKGFPVYVRSSEVTEKQMNDLCSNAVYMEICISIVASEYTRLRCPRLRELRPCLPGRPAIQIKNNLKFREFLIPVTVIYPQHELIYEITENPVLDITIITWLKKKCERCLVTANLGCDLQKRTYSNKELVAACAGKRIIRPAQGYILKLSSSSTTEQEMNALCSQAVFMEICIDITNSQYRALRCPYLRELRPCQPGRTAIRIVDNFLLETLIIPWHFIYPQGDKILEISGNPRLSITIIEKLKILCPGCIITANLGCGLQKRDYSTNELVDACAGKEIIKPAQGYILILNSDSVTEMQLNALCSRAVYMEICITISHSQFLQLRCPYLRELKPCMPGVPAINVTSNSRFQNLLIPSNTIYPEGSLIIEVIENPMIPLTEIKSLKRWCPQCRILPAGHANPGLRRCQLEARTYTDNEVIQICSGTEVIKPIQGFPLIVSSTDVTEKAMNDLCSNAVYMEICISIVNSNYRRLRCPRLRELRSCLPGRPAIQIVNNFQLVEFLIPVNVRFPQTELIFEITENPVLDITIITWLKKKCERCQITANFACDLQKRTYNNKELVAACAGKKIIRPAEGYMLVLSSSSTTEAEMNALCSQATFMEICIDITHSQYRAFRCPYLKELRPCQPGRPAIRIVDNLKLEVLEISWQFTFPVGDLILEITGNPLVPYFIIEKLKRLCPACTITANLGCDLQERHYSANELVDACAGKTIIKPAPGYILQLDSRTTTEYQMNALCSQAIFMEICITISHSQYRQLRCPNLRVLRPCLPGMPAIIVTDNNFFETLLIPPQTLYPQGDLIVRVTGNPRLNQWTFFSLKTWCKQCDIELRPPTTKPVLRQCQLQARQYSSKELVRVCAGAQVIKPYARIPLMVVSSEVTEIEMNAMFAEVVFMEICIVVVDSNFRALRFPRLQEIRPCRPGQPAIKVVGNILLEELYIPLDVRYPQGVLIFEISENPLLSITFIQYLKTKCRNCVITANLACDLQSRTYTSNQLIAACAGKRIIRPAPGYILELSSASTTEQQMNALCSNAVFMEICIDITRSQYKSFRCPHLKQLRSCMPGRPAIRIVDNIELSILEISRFTFPAGEMIIEIQENPLISITIITQLKKICPYCLISANLGCGLAKRDYTDNELIAACAGKRIIKPAEGYLLVLDSKSVSEAQINALCSRAVYMNICITISHSQFQQIRCPYLKYLVPCMPNRPALQVTYNNLLTNIVMSDSLRVCKNSKSLEIFGNPRLSPTSLANLKRLCPNCIIH